jgi:hypothetical protein
VGVEESRSSSMPVSSISTGVGIVWAADLKLRTKAPTDDKDSRPEVHLASRLQLRYGTRTRRALARHANRKDVFGKRAPLQCICILNGSPVQSRRAAWTRGHAEWTDAIFYCIQYRVSDGVRWKVPAAQLLKCDVCTSCACTTVTLGLKVRLRDRLILG